MPLSLSSSRTAPFVARALLAGSALAAALGAQVDWKQRFPSRSTRSLSYHARSSCADPGTARVFSLDEIIGQTTTRHVLYEIRGATRIALATFPTRPVGTIRLGYDRKRDVVTALIEGAAGRFETWEWDARVWRRVDSSTQRLASSDARLHWDAAGQRLVLLHDGVGTSGRFEVYDFVASRWVRRATANAPAAA